MLWIIGVNVEGSAGHFPSTPVVCRHSPIEGSVGLMLEHLVKVFQGFHLSGCLQVQHKQHGAAFVLS